MPTRTETEQPRMLPSAGPDPLAEAAAILGLQYIPTRLPHLADTPESNQERTFLRGRDVTGVLDGVTVKVHASGGRQSQLLFYGVLFPQVGLGFRLRRRTWGRRLMELVGAGGIEIGSPAFEEVVHIGGSHHERIGSFLTEKRQVAILDLIMMIPDVLILDGSIDGTHRRRRFQARQTADIVGTIEALVSTARSLTEWS